MEIFAKNLGTMFWPAGNSNAKIVAGYIWVVAIYGSAVAASSKIGMQPYSWDMPAQLVDLAFWGFVANAPIPFILAWFFLDAEWRWKSAKTLQSRKPTCWLWG